MVDNYFDPDAEAPPVAGDTSSSDMSKSKVRQAWDQFSSRPENNAALLQFGIAMMQPRAKGQGFLGQVGNSIGAAGEAASGNIAAQEAEAERASKQAERESTAGYRDAQAAAAGKTADAYSRQVDAMGAGKGAKTAASLALAQQRAFQQWLLKPIDTTGMSQDPILEAVKKNFPNVKSKADIINDPMLKKKVLDSFRTEFTDPGETPDTSSAPPVAAQPPAPGAAAMPPPGVPAGARYYQGHWYTRGPSGEAIPVPGF